MSSAEESVTLLAQCHCGTFSATWSIPSTSLPLKASLCSCHSCRHITGQLFASYAVIPETATQLSQPAITWTGNPHLDTDPADSVPEPWQQRAVGRGTLQQYRFGPRLVHNFCGVCGASIANFEPHEWEFTSGILRVVDPQRPDTESTRGIEGLLDRQALFAGDAPDGGALIWLPSTNSAGRPIELHAGFRDSPVVNPHTIAAEFAHLSAAPPAPEDTLAGRCKCGTVRFSILRPDPANPARGGPEDNGRRWWLAEPDDPQCARYYAELEACTSCNLCTGFEVQPWMYVPVVSVKFLLPGGAEVLLSECREDELPLKHYKSSEKVSRAFCPTCGANVWYSRNDRVPNIINFPAGLMEDKSGAVRCDGWVRWAGFDVTDTIDRGFTGGIVNVIGKS